MKDVLGVPLLPRHVGLACTLSECLALRHERPPPSGHTPTHVQWVWCQGSGGGVGGGGCGGGIGGGGGGGGGGGARTAGPHEEVLGQPLG
jgi:hypothetical protein